MDVLHPMECPSPVNVLLPVDVLPPVDALYPMDTLHPTEVLQPTDALHPPNDLHPPMDPTKPTGKWRLLISRVSQVSASACSPTCQSKALRLSPAASQQQAPVITTGGNKPWPDPPKEKFWGSCGWAGPCSSGMDHFWVGVASI